MIFSGYNSRAIISFCRVANKYKIPLIIIAKSEDDNILKTEYKKYVMHIREKFELDFDYIQEIFNKIKEEYVYEKYIVLPSTEALNRFMLKYRIEFERMAFSIPLSDQELYETISDKYSFGELCSKNNILVPKEIKTFEGIEFPVVIKSKKYMNERGEVFTPEIISNFEEFDRFIDRNDMKDFYVQQYIEGESYYLLYYFDNYGNYESFSQKNIIQQNNGKSMIAAIASNIHNMKINQQFVELFKKIKFKGLVMVEVKYYNEEFYMIEANPRLWGPSQLFVDAGCSFFERLLIENGFRIKLNNKVINNDAKYFWFGGIIQDLIINKEIKLHTNNIDELSIPIYEYLQNDIYLRQDTKEIFYEEIKKVGYYDR